MELDDLKKSWQETNDDKKYDATTIFNMLKSKSTSVAKAIFIFTVFEFLLIIGFFVYSIVLGHHSIDKKTLQYIDIETINRFGKSSIIGIVLTLFFMLLAYRYYKKIRYDQNTKALISSIVKFRKVIDLFILLNVILLIISSTPMYYELGKGIYLSKHIGEIGADQQAKIYGYVAVGISIFFILILALLYYCVLYFAFLKKLTKNLRELKEVS